MTIDEAANILNVKRAGIQAAEETELQKMLKVRACALSARPKPGTLTQPPCLQQNFDHLFQANTPLTPEGKPHSSHYLQSKIVRAKERIEAELAAAAKAGKAPAAGAAAEGGATAPKAPEGKP